MSTLIGNDGPLAGTTMPAGDPQQMRAVQYFERRRIGRRIGHPAGSVDVLFLAEARADRAPEDTDADFTPVALFPAIPWGSDPEHCACYKGDGIWCAVRLADTFYATFHAAPEQRRALAMEVDAAYGPLNHLPEFSHGELDRFYEIRLKIIAGGSLR